MTRSTPTRIAGREGLGEEIGDAGDWGVGVRGERIALLDEIGRGGMGVIYRARDADLHREIAVKVIQERHRDYPELVRRFVGEARIAGQLQHPGVVPVHEMGTLSDGRPYFVMKLVRGKTLAEMLAEGPVPAPDRHRLLPVFLQVVRTLAYAHANGVVHGDLTPSNVMVGDYGEVQVMDWGLARIVSGGDGPPGGEWPRDGRRGQSGGVMGTAGYLAPEQFAGEAHQPQTRADVFALGSILCEILTGSPAYGIHTSDEMRERELIADPSEAIARLGSCGADEELVELVRDCVAADPALRPGDAGEMALRLTAYLDEVVERLRASELERVEAQTRAARNTSAGG